MLAYDKNKKATLIVQNNRHLKDGRSKSPTKTRISSASLLSNEELEVKKETSFISSLMGGKKETDNP